MKLPMSAGPGQDGPDQWDWPVGPVPDHKDGRQTLRLGMAARRASKPQQFDAKPKCLPAHGTRGGGSGREQGKARVAEEPNMGRDTRRKALLCDSARPTLILAQVVLPWAGRAGPSGPGMV